jgi:hypothetical protein
MQYTSLFEKNNQDGPSPIVQWGDRHNTWLLIITHNSLKVFSIEFQIKGYIITESFCMCMEMCRDEAKRGSLIVEAIFKFSF